MIAFRSQTFARSLSNATLSFAILAVTSSSMCTVLGSASQVGKFTNNCQFLSFHSDSWFIIRFSRCLLVLVCCQQLQEDLVKLLEWEKCPMPFSVRLSASPLNQTPLVQTIYHIYGQRPATRREAEYLRVTILERACRQYYKEG